MPAPRWLARFNRSVTNRLTLGLSPYLPGFGVVVHAGRRSGRVYRTPINVFRTPTGFSIALTYGPDSEWVRNVLARGGCGLETGGRRWRLTRPRLVHDVRRQAVPPLVRVPLGLLNVADFLEMDVDLQ